MAAKLEPKHKALADFYLVHRNGARAAAQAGYSKTSAKVTASRILRHPNVKDYVAAKTKQLDEEARIAAYLVREELAILAHSDIRNFDIGAKGKVTLAKGVPEEAWRSVQSIEIEHVGAVAVKTKLRLWPKNDAVRMAGEHLAMFKQVVETRDLTLEDALDELDDADSDAS